MSTESTGFPPDDSGRRLAEALGDVDPFLTATPEDVQTGLRRAFISARIAAGVSGKPGPCVSQFPKQAAETAMRIARPVLEAKDVEIARLREQAESVRADERRRCVAWLRDKAKAMSHRANAYVINWLVTELEAGKASAEDIKENGHA